ncbi:MAG: NAD(P)/FAD-dependent oxidoreductase [Phreatobacter sp.]|uniref:NAD(P)/FAD-dependent oxidoreductase n=1 Tax=Phreatobacter sp. TaxID=1966341 RepID=UPI001A5D76D0|nr:NAD(P)/FAD-dependent oxidoreductase [Phreatobacter sp.]MBL8569309.1 NAD(P)/FAD-dependent oxidoreductase [Phreatobacter sp.]
MDARGEASRWLSAFSELLSRDDPARAAELFLDECYWRDFVAFTWNIATLEGRAAIAAMLASRGRDTRASAWTLDGEPRTSDAGVEFWFTFETKVGRGRGHARVRDGRCWTLLTTLRELKGYEEKSGETRSLGTTHGAVRDRATWADQRAADARLGYDRQPYVLIVGGGQGGLGLGARLKQIGVPALIVDRHPRAGDAWRNRYRSLCLHDPVWFDHMPYLPFPDHWPVFTPKDKIGDWLEAYASIMELDLWTGTTCRKAAYDAARGEWTVEVDRAGELVTLRPTHLVLATGMSGKPQVPHFPGQDLFRGIQHHSSAHSGGEGYAGKRCVIVGANNSAHDIAAGLWEHGAEVTMIQRSPTLVVRSETVQRLGWSLYSEAALRAGIDVDKADLTVASTPFAVLPQFLKPVVERMKRDDAAFYDALRAVGFQLTFGEDETGLGLMYPRRGSGYYIDVGASELIATRQIALRSGVGVAGLSEDAVLLDDGTRLPADLVVYATGYGSMTGWAAELISPEVADRVGPCWGMGSGTARDPGPWVGELRNMWKPTAQEGLWFHGGNLAQSRHYSRYLAIQLKARFEGLPTPVFGVPS